jgi:hypothetical protein
MKAKHTSAAKTTTSKKTKPKAPTFETDLRAQLDAREKAAKYTPEEDAARERADLGGLANEAMEHLTKLAAIFASVDAELDENLLGGSGSIGADRRLAFNRAFGGVVADLEAIQCDHVAPFLKAEVTS